MRLAKQGRSRDVLTDCTVLTASELKDNAVTRDRVDNRRVETHTFLSVAKQRRYLAFKIHLNAACLPSVFILSNTNSPYRRRDTGSNQGSEEQRLHEHR